MAKNKVSDWSSTAANNTDIGGINIAEGCAPSGINNAIRELMAQVKDMQTGTDADNFVVGGNLTVSNTLTANSSVGTAGQALLSRGAGLSPQWGTVFVSGMIMMWSGSIASIPSGWLLCDGTNSTPDLRDRFVIGARQDDSSVAKTNVTGSLTQTGGSKDAIVVSHTHTVTDPGHKHQQYSILDYSAGGYGAQFQVQGPLTWPDGRTASLNDNMQNAATGVSVNSTGSSGTNANLPPYYALAFIMKA